jgi:hypothetical protein
LHEMGKLTTPSCSSCALVCWIKEKVIKPTLSAKRAALVRDLYLLFMISSLLKGSLFCFLDVLDYLVDLLLKLADVIASTIKVGTRPGYTLHNPPCFFDLLFSVPVQR